MQHEPMTATPVSPAFAWREQVQRRTRELLAAVPAEECDSVQTRWRGLVREALAPLIQRDRSPVPARLIDESDYDGFRLQRIVLTAMPGWQVGLDLFLPAHRRPAPLILCPCGHGPKWLPDHQLPPQVLARQGFAAALFDMPMFGERSRDNDHFVQGSQAAMVGLWSNIFFLIDALRVADYLETRPEIAMQHAIGVTGVSGGGVATLFLAQCDDRIRAIAPACCVAPFGGHLLEGLYTGCPESLLFGQARQGMDFDDILCLAAPLPCLVIGGTEDIVFTPEAMQQSMQKAQRAYRLQGAEARLSLYTEAAPHTYTPTMAYQAARWFHRWLGVQPPAQEAGAVSPLPEEALNCGTADATDGMLQFVRREIDALRATRNNADVDLRAVLYVPEDTAPAAIAELPAPRWGYRGLRESRVTTADGLALPMWEMPCPGAPPGALIAFSDEGAFPPLQQDGGLFGLRERMISAEMRGYGALTPAPSAYDVYGWCRVDRALSDLLWLCGETAMGWQIADALAVLEACEPGEAVTLYGRGEAALPALFAGLLHPCVSHIVLDEFLAGFSLLAGDAVPRWLRYQYVPDILRHFDLAELLAQRTDKQFLLINPCDGAKQRLDEVSALRLYGQDAPHLAVHVETGEGDRAGTIRAWLARPDSEEASIDPVLALHGWRPVRQHPFPTKVLGADLTGLDERRLADAALASKTLFRHYGLGTPVMAERLEREVCERFGCRYALAVSSGSAALCCALAGIGIGPGDEVILPAFSWHACYSAIVLHGATPVFCEIDRTLNLDPQDFARKITPATKAIIVVHYQGGAAEMEAIMATARAHQVRVLEDGAQSIGARYHGRALSTIGDVGTFSFQGNKILCAGEGGMVLTDDSLIFERAVRYHDLGCVRPTFAAQLGHNGQAPAFAGNQYRMGELAAAVALAQFGKLEWMLGRCRMLAQRIRARIREELPTFRFRHMPDPDGDAGITLFLDMETPQRAQAMAEALLAEGIPLGPSSGMTNLLHLDFVAAQLLAHPAQPPFTPGHGLAPFTPELTPHTDTILSSFVAIGIGPRYTLRDADDIATAICKVHHALIPNS